MQSQYSRYTTMGSVPAGAILNHIINKQKLKKSEVARISNLIPQRLNDLIMGNRRFTVQNSFCLESALGIDIKGFFYLLQANNDIFVSSESLKKNESPDISKFSKATFWDMDLSKVDFNKSCKLIIARVLEYGTDEELSEIVSFYGKAKVVEIAKCKDNFRVYDIVEQKLKSLCD